MKYRIIKKTMRNGKSEYWIQKRFLFFWIYLDQMVGYGSYSYIVFTELEDAKQYVNRCISIDESERNRKIVKKEILNND